MERPNQSDPSMVDVFDDSTGEYITTIPGASSSQQPNPTPAPAPQGFDMGVDPLELDASGQTPIQAGRLPAPRIAARPGLMGSDEMIRPEGVAPSAPVPGADVMKPGSVDKAGEDPIFDVLKPGTADEMAMSAEGTPGGMVPHSTVSTGPEHGAAGAAAYGDLANTEKSALLDESLAKMAQLKEDKDLQARMEQKVRDDQAENAMQMKIQMERRDKVAARLAEVEKSQPDRNRAFPKGFGLVATYIGAIAGGMLKGLNGGGRNAVLDSLDHRLDEDVQLQREQKSDLIKEYTRQTGSVDAAVELLKAKQKEIVVDHMKAQLLGSQNKVAPAAINAWYKKMEAEIERHKVDAVVKLDRDLAITEQYAPPTSVISPKDPAGFRNGMLADYARQTGLKPNQAHDQWNDWNKSFIETASVRGSLQTAQNAIEKFRATKDVAGFGFLDEKLPDTLRGKDAIQTRQIIGKLMSDRIKQLSGQAASEGEVGRIRESLLGGNDPDFDSMSTGLKMMDREFQKLDEAKSDQNPTFALARQRLIQMRDTQRNAADPEQMRQRRAQHPIVEIPEASRIAKVHNNPGNLSWTTQAPASEKGEPKAGGGYWRKFPTVRAGMESLARQVQSDQERGLNVRQFAEKYAPKGDGNDTENWIKKFSAHIEESTGSHVDEQTPLSDILAGRAAVAIAQIESGSQEAK